MIKSANNYPVSQLIDTDDQLIYVIPRYQREYTWRKNEWEQLFDDIQENNPGYFLGSIICINQSDDSVGIQKLELVDGQQRLTTLSLLFAAIYHALKADQEHLDDDQRFELIKVKQRLVLKKDNEQMRIVPQIQNNNHGDYQAILADIGVTSPHDRPSNAGNRRIYRAFRYFQERIEKMTTNESNAMTTLMDFQDKVSQASMVKIEVASHADAYTLFESLNNRGVPLSAVDLIKNKLLAKLENKEPGEVDYYFNRWMVLLSYLGDDHSVQERFFRQYYNAFRDELKEVHQVPVATRSNIIQIYEKLIDKDPLDTLEQFINAGRLYSHFLDPEQEGASEILGAPLKNLERIQGAPAYLLLLFLQVHRKQLQLTDAHLASIVDLLVRFFVRRNLTDTPPTRDLTRIFMALIEKFMELTGDTIVTTIHQQLVALSASDAVFCEKLAGPIYDENFGVTRFILSSLEEQSMTKDTWRDLWRMENKHAVFTVEHIFPQGENIPKAWVDMIADGDTERAEQIRQSHVHKLGNLTLTAFNSALGNKSFEDKRDRKAKGHHGGYKNGFSLNEGLATAERWSVADIEARTTKLVDQAMDLFSLHDANNSGNRL